MKKYIMVTVGIVSIFIFSGFAVSSVSAKTKLKSGEENKPIPEDVMKILTKSCANCHTEPGNVMALSLVNISKWDKYSAEKQSAK